MSTDILAADNSIDTNPVRVIESGRYERAVTESMSTESIGDRLYRVTHGAEAYNVDLETSACSCADAHYRGDRYICKHAIRAALVEVFANRVSTEFVARVVNTAVMNPCPFGFDALCDGPVGPRLPCPGCINAVRSEGVDEWTVWRRAVTEART